MTAKSLLVLYETSAEIRERFVMLLTALRQSLCHDSDDVVGEPYVQFQIATVAGILPRFSISSCRRGIVLRRQTADPYWQRGREISSRI